ncbi:hypothetical protein [Vulcanisaeta sp. JCM 14467]|uniref:hypothetical protein n=1 Tax=Vulcanisaeta sp. JCM 14467 TaxID=1295370 RepID=UPI0006CF4C7A|nr:hypothetical protein [Vulcanisaeta sp. JCM 14467]
MLRSVGGVRLSPEAWRYLAVLASISIVTMYVEMVVMPSLLTIERQYGVTESEVSWVLSAETLAGLAFALSSVSWLIPTVGRESYSLR